MENMQPIFDRLDKIITILDSINRSINPPPNSHVNKSIQSDHHDDDELIRSNRSVFFEIMIEEGFNPSEYDFKDKSASIDYFVTNLGKINNKRAYLSRILPPKKRHITSDLSSPGVTSSPGQSIGFRQMNTEEVFPGVPLRKGACIYRDNPWDYTDNWIKVEGYPGGYVNEFLKSINKGEDNE